MTKKIQSRINLLRHSKKRRRPRRRSKSRRSKDSNAGTGENNTPDDTETNEDLAEVTSEQEEQENGQASPDE